MSPDLSVSLWVQNALANPFLNGFFSIITKLGDAGVFWIALGIVLLISKNTRLAGATLLLSLLFQYLVGEGIKALVNRPRPFQDYTFDLLIAAPKGSSFPSIHTSSAICCCTVYWLCVKTKPARDFRVPIVIVAVLIALSRIYLFVHYPTDVLAGALLGLIMAFVGIKLTRIFYQRGWLKFAGLDPEIHKE